MSNAMQVFKNTIAVLVMGLLLASAGARAETTGFGPLDPVLPLGAVDGWTAEVDDGTYWLENPSDPGAIRYFYSAYRDGDGGDRQAEVTVRLERAASDARAGLLYGFQSSPLFYYLILLGPGGEVDIYRRDEQGFQTMMSSTFEDQGQGAARLTIQETGRELSVLLDGRQVGSFESRGTGAGALGIAAVGQGRFGFSNYRESKGDQQGSLQGEAAQTASVPQGGAAVFKEHVVGDEGRGNFPAYRLLAPESWTVEGRVIAPNPAYNQIPYFNDIKATAPDGRFVQFHSFMVFGYNDLVQGRPLQPFNGVLYLRQPDSLGAYVTQMIEISPEPGVSNLKILSEEVLDDATEMVRRAAKAAFQGAEEFNRGASVAGEKMYYDIHVRRLQIAYDLKGQAMEETLFATVSSSVVVYPNGTVKAAQWTLADTYSVGGPAGSSYLEDPELAAIVRSLRMDQDWAFAIDRWYAGKRDEIVREGMARAAAAQGSWRNTRAQQSDDVLDISFKGWKSRNAISDAGQSNSVNMIHERTAYATPSGGSVNLPSFYSQVYTDGQGSYVLHNDANYQINSDPALNGRSWQQVQPIE
ncbi:MAG: hypothetical protein Kilf2KO_34200 [Rhodospirillales bacterium]